MKTRIIKTKIWQDSQLKKLSFLGRYVFIYLLTSPFISLTPYFELIDEQIALDTGLNKKQLRRAKLELTKLGKAFFYDGWVFIPNLSKHNPYYNSPKTKLAYEREALSTPQPIIDEFTRQIDSTIDSSMDSTMHSTPKTENRKQKEEKRTSLVVTARTVLGVWNLVFGTKLTSIRGIENNLAYWLESYQVKDLANAILLASIDPFWKKKITPTILLRKKNPQGEDVDRVSDLLAKKDELTSHLDKRERKFFSQKVEEIKKFLKEAKDGKSSTT